MVGLTTLAIVLAATSTATSVYGQIKQGQAAKSVGEANKVANDSQAELSDYNAGVAELQAKDAIARGQEQENRFRTQVRGIIGTQRAEFAGGNIDVGYGSAVDVQADAAKLGELDALTIRTNAAREAWGFRVQAEDYRRQGDILRKIGVNALAAGNANANAAYINAGATALGGTSSLLLKKYGMQQAGV